MESARATADPAPSPAEPEGAGTDRAAESGGGMTRPQKYHGESTVGFPATFRRIVIPAPEVSVRPVTDRGQPVRVRIESVQRIGDAFQYDLTAIGLEPGEHDVASCLAIADGSPHPEMPVLSLKVHTLLAAGQVEPHLPVGMSTGQIGWYLPVMVAVGVCWMLGLLGILFARRMRSGRPGRGHRQLSLAERIRPVLLRASRGDLTSAEGAELERTLTSFWKHRLRLEMLPADRLLVELKAHPEAGPLLRQLEAWLHAPAAGDPPDLESLLRPYRVFADRGD